MINKPALDIFFKKYFSVVSSLLVVAILFTFGCQGKYNTDRIQTSDKNLENSSVVGGVNIEQASKFSKQVAHLQIIIQNTETKTLTAFTCTGTFIEDDVVLTAAHCLATRPKEEIYSINISFAIDSDHVTFETMGTNMVINPEYKLVSDAALDLAIIRTADPLPADHVKTVLSTKRYPKGTPVLGIGFGRDFYEIMKETSKGPGILRAVNLKLMDGSVYGTKNTLDVMMDANKGISLGDSGGPLLVWEDSKFKQIGVASCIAMANDVGSFAVYNSVVDNADWFKEALPLLDK